MMAPVPRQHLWPLSPLRVGSGSENGLVVVLQDLQPARDVAGVIVTLGQGDLEVSTEERSPQLGNQLFLRIALIAETLTAKVAGKAAVVPVPVRHLVREGSVVAFGVTEGLELRHVDAVERGDVASAVSAVVDLRASGLKEASAASIRWSEFVQPVASA